MSEHLENLSVDRKRELLAQLLQKKAAQAAARPPEPSPEPPPRELRAEPAGEVPAGKIVAAPRDWDQPFPLNDLQQAYLFGRASEVELGQNSIHVYVEFDSAGLDLERLERSFARLVERHGMLRAVVLPDGRQQILDRVPPYQIQVTDLREAAPAAVEAELGALRERLSHQMFDVEAWPAFEIRVCQLPEGRQTVHFSLDLIMVDASSFLLLFKDWGRYYEDLDAELAPLEISFRDYVLAEQAFRASEAARPSRDYWMQRVPTLPPAPQLSLGADPASLGRPRFRRQTARLEAECWQRLKERASEAGLTPSMFLCAAYSEVLGTWSQSQRFTLNISMTNRLRLHPQVAAMVGVFSELNLLEVDLTCAESFAERAQRLQERLWTDLDHRHFGGVRLLRELARRREWGLRAQMPVVYTATLLDFSDLEWLGRVESFITQTPQVWIDHQMSEEGGSLVLHWDAVEALFPAGMLRDMFESYVRLLRRLADEPASWRAADLGLLPPAQAELRAAVNATGAPVPEGLLHAPFLERAREQPDRLAVASSSAEITYGELARRARALAHTLRNLGVVPNQLVAVAMEKGWEQVAAVLGILEAGGAYMPVDPAQPPARLRSLLERGEVGVVLTQPAVDRRVEWPDLPGVRRLCVERGPLPSTAEEPLPAVQTPTDLAYVIFTSGSTGEPKGVMIDHRGALNTVVDVNQRCRVGPDDRVLALSSLAFDLSVYDVFGLLAAGGTIVLPEPGAGRDPARWAELIAEGGITLWNSVPALLEMLVEHCAGRGLPEMPLRCVMLSGDWIPLDLPARFRALVPRAELISMGGATEASIWSILYPVERIDPAWKSVPYGRPMLNQTFHVLNERLEPAPVWVPGSLFIGGIGLAQGYWRDEEKTSRSFFVHPRTGERLYRTGDLGRYLPDGNIEFLGREDFQVKVQGHRIELGEIEAALLAHPGVREAVATALGDPRGKRRLAAYVVPAAGQTLPEPELRAFLRSRLPEYMVPTFLVELAALPLTANGKVDRKALPAPTATAPAAAESAAAPSVAGRVERIVARVLGLDRVEPGADLIDLGASSIDMVRIANQIESELGYRPRIEEIFLAATVGALAAACERHVRTDRTDRREPAPAPAAQPLLLLPEERAAFKREQRGLRREDPKDGRPAVQLVSPLSDEAAAERYRRRRSWRAYRSEPMRLEQLEELLGCLRQIRLDGEAKFLYPSGGGLYPVQTYLWIRPGRVEGVPGGGYYYHPVEHRLIALAPDLAVDRSVHAPSNREIFTESALSIFLVARLSAIAPLYGEHALPLATVEAGYMGQLLMDEAPAGVGLCPIGGLEFDRLRAAFDLEPTDVLVHSLVGGLADPLRDRPAALGLEAAPAEAAGDGIARVRRDGRGLPLSFAQQRLWFLDQMDPGNHLYNRATTVRFRGPLRVEVLERCLREIVRRHEILRTTFALENGEPVQVLRPEEERDGAPFIPLAVEDLRGLSAEAREARTRELSLAEALAPFDLSRGPLLRLRLLVLGEDDHLLVMTVHHIVGDGWAFGVFLREVGALYEAFLDGRPSPLPELAVQYADFAAWQRRQAGRGLLEEQLAYWRRQLAGAPPVLELPADRPRPAVQSFRGAQLLQRLPRELVSRLREIGREAGATLFMSLLAGFEALLSRRTGQTDLVLGSPIANRNRAELEPLIGFFVNALVLRTDLSRDPTFRELVGRVREVVLGAYAHQDLPFEKLVEDLKIERSLGHTPLFQVWFVFQNTPMPAGRFCGLTVTNEEIDDGTTKFDLLLFAAGTEDGGLEVTWRYGTDLFEESTIARLQGQLEALLNHAVTQPDARLSELELLSEAEKERKIMERTQRQESEVKKLRFARRKAVDLTEEAELVRIEPLAAGQPLPLLATPAAGEVDLTDWARGNRDLIEERLSAHGAILFRGFGVGAVADFERFASTLCGDLYGEYGDLPREEEGRKIYHSTPYPPDKTILFHNESSHMPRWPTRQFFYCVLPSQTGGETPIVDGRVMVGSLPAGLVRDFEEKRVVYVRNFTEGLDVPWQEFFKTEDRRLVEERCRAEGMEITWKGNNLQTRQLCPAVTRHPRTGERIWFNQLQLHHPACLEPEVRTSMLSLFGEENLPRNVLFGDGTPIPDAVMDEISATYWRNAVSFPWQAGDILMLDNMLVAHARNPYSGPRKIVVGMGSMLGVEQLAGEEKRS